MKLLTFHLIRGVIAFILGFILFSLMRTSKFKKYKKKSNAKREIMLSILVGYIFVLCVFMFTTNVFMINHGINLTSDNINFSGVFLDRIKDGAWGINIVPFKTIKSYLKLSNNLSIFMNIWGNIIIFIPLTFLLMTVYREIRKFKYIFLISFGISFFVEFIQFFIGRSVDIDDIILNVLGGVLGYCIFKILEKFKFKITEIAI